MAADASAPDLAAALRDQAGGALLAGVDPEPAQRHAQAVAQADQEIDVGHAPYPPRQRTAQLDAPEIDHRLLFTDLRQAAGMLVVKRRRRAALQPCLDGRRNILSLLLGRRRDARYRISIGTCDCDRIADGEDIGMTGYREVGLYLQASGAIGGDAEPVGGG